MCCRSWGRRESDTTCVVNNHHNQLPEISRPQCLNANSYNKSPGMTQIIEELRNPRTSSVLLKDMRLHRNMTNPLADELIIRRDNVMIDKLSILVKNK